MGKEQFSYLIQKSGLVRIFWEGRCVMTLGGKRGHKLTSDVQAAKDEARVQYLLQRGTGNFKRGNERPKR